VITSSASTAARVRVWILMRSRAPVSRLAVSPITYGGTRHNRSSVTAKAARYTPC
jgi:hypothetical protein